MRSPGVRDRGALVTPGLLVRSRVRVAAGGLSPRGPCSKNFFKVALRLHVGWVRKFVE